MKVRALMAFSHAGKRYRKGDELEMRDRLAAAMIKSKRAEEAPPAPPPKGRYSRRDMVATPPAPEPRKMEESDDEL
jgi:hypothetical protein